MKELLVKDIIEEARIIKDNGRWQINTYHYNLDGERERKEKVIEKEEKVVMGCFVLTIIPISDCKEEENEIIIGYIDRLEIFYDMCALNVRWTGRYPEEYSYFFIDEEASEFTFTFPNIILKVETV
jgi:hypothetical protein